MTPEECIETCCVIKCTNNPSNSKVKFFSFPEHRFRSYQRNRWVQAIKNTNGRYWMPTVVSLVCSDHFVKGHPSANPQDTDYVPSIFSKRKKTESSGSRTVTVKKFGFEYIKHGALLQTPSRANVSSRNRAYEKLADAFGIPLTMVRVWERHFREYIEEKMAEPPDKRKTAANGKPHWVTTVAKRLYVNPMHRLPARGPVSPGGVVAALCAAARARGTLCSTPMYNDVRRVLRLNTAISDLHAIWVSAQRVSLQQVAAAARAGDAARAAPPPAAAAVADLVLLHADVDIVTDESVTLYEESAALHTLWQLIQRHRLEDAAPAHSRVRAQRWSRAHRSYIESGRTVSLVVLQRRWYELKQQARVRLAMHWRRPPGPHVDDLSPSPDPSPDPASDPDSTPQEVYPRPAPLHIAILKRYPHIATGQFTSWRQQVLEGIIVTELLEEENDVQETQSNNNEQSTTTKDTGDDAAAKQLYPNMTKVEQPTFDVPMVEQRPDNDPVTEGPADTVLLKEENDIKDIRSNVSQQSTDTADTDADAAVKQLYPNMSKVEQPTVDEPKNEQTFYDVPLVEQSTAVVQLAEHTTENYPLAEEPTVHKIKIEQPIDSGSLTENHVAGQTTDNDHLVVQRTVDDPLPDKTTKSDLLPVQSTVVVPKIEQPMDYDLLNNRSTLRTLAENPVVHAGNAVTGDIPNILNEQIHCAKDKSNEVIPPQCAYPYDTDTDTEDNLVIDECSNQTPYSHKLEPVPHTETHSFDTVSPHAALRKLAPTIEVLHMIDPNMVKTEILFESDDDDIKPYNQVDKDKIELDAKKEVSFISNRIMFVDEEPVASVCDVKSEDDVTDRMDCENEQKMDDPVNETSTIDPKLLMDTQVRLFKIDEIPAWIKNVRKDNSIRVSRIHRRYYTPKPKNVRNNTKKRTQNMLFDVELRTSTRLTSTKTHEIKVDQSCLDKIANTDSIRQLCSNIKRELIDEELKMFEDETRNKKAKTESDSDDDKPLLVLRKGMPPRETTEVSQATVRQTVEESSSDDELMMNDEMFNMLRGEERKRGRGAYYAASTIEWSAAFAPALGRVAKRVSLPDIESVRRYNSGMQVAQVAPITSSVQAGQPLDDSAADDTPEAAAAAPTQQAETEIWDDARETTHVASHTEDLPTFHGNRDMPYGLLPSSHVKPLAWRALDLPGDDELQAALDGLTAAPAAEPAQERSHCCAARRHREVNDSRRRIGLDEIPLHNHPNGECTCCCTHLSDADARHRLDQQLRVLHQDIEQMLRKSAGGRIHSKPAQKHSRSPSPARASTSVTTSTSVHKLATKVAPSNTATVAKGLKAKPVPPTNRSKKRRSRARAPPAPAPSPPAPPVSDFEEWQRQKNMNAKYFHINSILSSKKDKSTTGLDNAEQSTTTQGSAVQSTTAQGRAVQSPTAQGRAVQSPTAQGRAVQIPTAQGRAVQSTTAQTTAVQSPITLGTAVQSTTARDTGVQSPIAQGFGVESTTAQGRAVHSPAVQSPTAQNHAVQSSTPQTVTKKSTIGQNATPPQNEQPGLMPYIRQSRLISPQEEPRRRRAKPVPARRRRSPVAIASKLADMRHATGQALNNTVADELKEGTKNLTIRSFQSQAAGLRRMNLTTEQVSEPTQPVQVTTGNSVPTDKPVSILEEYSRTLNTEPVNNTPVVNALSLRVPSGPEGSQTTIVMAVTLPSDKVIKQTINRLYANETVDLTEESETSQSVIKKTTAPDLVAAVKFLCMNPLNKNKSGRSLLKSENATESGRSLHKTKIVSALDGLPDTTDPSATRDKALKIMSLSKKLNDVDVIEIEDSDSNHSNSNDVNQSENSILINKSSNPTVYTNKGTNQAKAGSTMESSDQSTSKKDESSNQAASNSTEAVSESANQAGATNTTKKAIDEDILRSKKPRKTRKSKERKRFTMPAVLKGSKVSEEAVSSHSVARPCSRIPELTSLTDGSRRCPARFANVAAMTDFMATLRRAAAQADKEVYCHKWSAIEQPVSALPCGGTLLCVDGSRPPLVLPAHDPRELRARASPHARAHLVLTDADPPCALPTYWTLSSFGQMARVLPDELVSTDAADVAGRTVVELRGGGARWCDARGEWLTPREDRKICEKNHNFKILTAFCSADGIRQAARAGASLLLLNVLRARIVVLALRRDELRGVVRHHASADVEEELLRELEGLLDEAEIDEKLGGRTDIISQ